MLRNLGFVRMSYSSFIYLQVTSYITYSQSVFLYSLYDNKSLTGINLKEKNIIWILKKHI